MAKEWQDLGAIDDAKWKDVGTVTVTAAPPRDEFVSNAGGAAFGRPRRGQAEIKPPTPLEAFGVGVTKSVVDPFLGAAQLATGGNLGTSNLAKRLQEEADFYYEDSPKAYLAGRGTGMVIPATAGAKAVGAIPSFAARNRYTQGAILGTTGGLITPEDTGKTGLDLYKSQAIKGAVGGVTGPVATGAIDAGGWLAKGLRRMAEPFYESGKDRIIGRALTEAAGGEADKAISNIRNFKSAIPGSLPTTAEVAQVPSLAALERSAIASTPEVSNMVTQRNLDRNVARKGFLEELSGMGGAKDILVKLRESTANKNYANAFNAKMAFDKVPTELLQEKADLLKSDAIQAAVNEARKNISNKGLKVANPTQSIQGLHEIKLALDDQIAKLQKPDMSTAEINKIRGLEAAKTRLLNFLENDAISPAYKQAREIYAKQSKPISQFEAVESITNKVLNPQNDQIYANRLARELKTAEKGKTVSPSQLDKLKQLQQDVAMQQFAMNAGKSTGSDTVQKLAYANLLSDMGLPSALRGGGTEALSNIGGQISNLAYSNANKELARKLAQTMIDPQEAARVMELVRSGKVNPNTLPESTRNAIRLLMSQGAVQTYQGAE